MIFIRIRETGELCTEDYFRSLHPNTSFPQHLPSEVLNEYEADEVHYVDPPSTTLSQSVTQDGADLVDGRWQTKWIVTELPEEESAARLSEAQKLVWNSIKVERDRRKALGVQVGAHWFHSDDSSRIQQLALVMMGANIPTGLQWKTLSGEFVTMTQQLAAQIFGAIALSDQAIFTKAEQHKNAMLLTNNPYNYDYSTGWPEVYASTL